MRKHSIWLLLSSNLSSIIDAKIKALVTVRKLWDNEERKDFQQVCEMEKHSPIFI